MDNIQSQVSQKIQGATNILVTVSSNPSVDQLTACLGLTLWLNKLGKHATAVFSGDIPNALEFLQPEVTIEKNTDSLRDFIIALDKSKADKLRYKVEDRVVKIFITPYRTSLSSDDLEFSQGDFNVDAIIALGVTKQEDLDNAIVAHGRILHDATVITINTTADGGIGAINWHDPTVSSLCELIYELGQSLDVSQLDPQIATSLLTGIVAETNRFSNTKTTPQTMSAAAALMKAGANQQLVANKLEEAGQSQKEVQNNQQQELNDLPSKTDQDKTQETPVAKNDNGILEISHQDKDKDLDRPPIPNQPVVESNNQPSPVLDQKVAEDDHDHAGSSPITEDNKSGIKSNEHIISEPPTLSGNLNSSLLEDESGLNLPTVENDQLLNRQPLGTDNRDQQDLTQPSINPPQPNPQVYQEPQPSKANLDIAKNQTLDELEHAVDSPHIDSLKVDDLRDKIQDALKVGPPPEPQPTEALNAINIDLNDQQEANPTEFNPDAFELHDNDQEQSSTESENSPPQVPPPIVPPDFLPPAPPQN